MKKLKKTVAAVLTAVTVLSAYVCVYATDEFGVAYTTPNPKLKKANGQAAGNYIGVNQETIEIGYPKELSAITDDITLLPEPKGGVIKTIDQNKLILTFGELEENTAYTLTIPENSVKATDGTYASAYADTFQTVPKALAEDDFSSAGYSTPQSGIQDMASGVVLRNKGTLPNYEQKSINGDKYLMINPNKGTDFFLSVRAPFDNISTSKIVTKLVFNANGGKNCEAHNTGSIYGWESGDGISFEGFSYPNFSSFAKNENGFYDVTILDSLRTVGAVQSNKISAEYTVSGFSNIDNAEPKTAKTVKNISQSDCKIYTVAPVKLYTGKENCDYEVNISYLKSGYYTIPAPLGKPEWDSAAKTLTYAMNTDIADASNVKIGDLETEALINNEERTLTLSYTGEILSGETYAINFTDIESMDGFGGAEDAEYTAFTEGVEAISPDSGKTLDITAGEIKITFSSVYNEEDLKNSISFTDSDGNEPNGGILIVQNSDNPTEVFVKFGNLKENSDYYLGISDALLPSTALYKFRTGDKYIINDDFEAWETGEIEIENPKAYYFTKNNLIFGFNNDNNLQTAHFEIKEENGEKYLSYNNTAKDKDIAVGFALPSALKEGKIIVEMGIRAGNANGSFANSAFDILPYYSASVPGKGAIVQSSRPRIASFSNCTTDKNGFIKLKVELTKTAVSGGASSVKAVYKDAENSEKSTSVTVKHTTPAEADNVIGSIAFAKIYSNEDAFDSVNLSYVRAYYPKKLGIVNSLDNFEPKSREIELFFNEDVLPESLSENPITLTNGEKTVTTSFVSYDNRKAVFALSEHLDYGANYEISFSGVAADSDTEVISDSGASFKTCSKPLEITDINGLSFKIKNNTNEIRSFTAAAVLYNESGKVIGTAFSEKSSVNAGDIQNIVITPQKEYSTYTLILWDTSDGIAIIK